MISEEDFKDAVNNFLVNTVVTLDPSLVFSNVFFFFVCFFTNGYKQSVLIFTLPFIPHSLVFFQVTK